MGSRTGLGVGLGAYWLPGGMLVTEAVGRTGCPCLVAGVLSTPWLCPGVTPGVIRKNLNIAHAILPFGIRHDRRRTGFRFSIVGPAGMPEQRL